MKKIYSRQAGFTLLELLVVIGIIGILVGIGSIAYSSAQTRARDSRRRGDIEAISKSLEQYYAVNITYPLSSSCAGFETYLAGREPTDPKTGDAYIADGDCDAAGNAFCICSQMEVPGSGNAFVKGGGAPTTCVWDGGSGTRDYYCAQNQQ